MIRLRRNGMPDIIVEQMDGEMYQRLRALLDSLGVPREGSFFEQIEQGLLLTQRRWI